MTAILLLSMRHVALSVSVKGQCYNISTIPMLHNLNRALQTRIQKLLQRKSSLLYFFKQPHPLPLVLFSIILLCACSIGIYFFHFWHHTVITLAADGFHPSEVIILPGETVTFRTTTHNAFWPASNVHPTHTAYPAFDPKRPIASNATWSFTFPKEGVYGFHDHLAPQFLGIVYVTNKAIPLSLAQQCENTSDLGAQKQCWDSQIREAHVRGGMQASFDVFTQLYQTQQAFSNDCHGYTHTLGELAYADYRDGKPFPINKEMAYCSYGFFHGYIEALMADTGDVAHIRDFCDFLASQAQGEFSITTPCIHGIGHGVTDASDPRSFGDVNKIIDPGIALCKQVGRNEYEVKICATGVFDSLGIMLMNKEHGLSVDPNDPYAVCKAQKEDIIRQACYEDFKSVIMSLSEHDIYKAIAYVNTIADTPEIKKAAMENIAVVQVYNITNEDFSSSTKACHSLKDDAMREACIGGLAMGFVNIGTLDKEYVRALDFCGSKEIYADELDVCYANVLHATQARYPSDVFKTICATVPEVLRSHNFYTTCAQ